MKRATKHLVSMHVLVDPDKLDRVDQAADEQHVDRSTWVRAAIDEKLQRETGE